MSGLNLYSSNSLDNLALKFNHLIKTNPLSSALDPEFIVIQSQAVKSWLALNSADYLGIWANAIFFFPNAFLEKIFSNTLDLSLKEGFERDLISWQIMDLLKNNFTDNSFVPLKNYLKKGDDFKIWQLSSQIANTFDQYLTYRPDLILGWEDGLEDHWQAELWRLLIKKNTNFHKANLKKLLLEKLEKLQKEKDSMRLELPERISFLGISVLPPFHAEIIEALSHLVEINFFYLNPSPEFWAYIKSDKELSAIRKNRSKDSDLKDLYFEKGNPLLASWGKLGRDFLNLLMDYDWDESESSLFKSPSGETLLSYLKRDIYQMIDRGSDQISDFFEENLTQKISGEDFSILINSCHSVRREIEVLHNYILDLLQQESSLKPNDILVVAPEIDKYTPFIRAYFSDKLQTGKTLPFFIADRSLKKESLLGKILINILDLLKSRFEVEKVWDLFSYEVVYQHFGLREENLEVIRKWLKETRIYWGADSLEKIELGLPGCAENTWQAGIDRLYLGYLLSPEEEQLIENIFPYDIEGQEISFIANFINYFNLLKKYKQKFSLSYSLKEWSLILLDLLDDFFGDEIIPDEAIESQSRFRELILKLGSYQEEANFNSKVDLKLIKAWLSKNLEEEIPVSHFFSGGITFAKILPMRGIPFKVICVLGMNNDSYPRLDQRNSFDLIFKEPRKGDRSLRDEDRYSFLEIFLAAQNRFYISYEGQSLMDNSEISPSVLVSELLDYLDQAFYLEEGNLRENLVVKHPLPPFSLKYFNGHDKRLFSYSKENLIASKANLKKSSRSSLDIDFSFSKDLEEDLVIDLNDLIDFFSNPASFFFKKKLGLDFYEKDEFYEEQESFSLEGLEKYELEEKLTKSCLRDDLDSDKFFNLYRSLGLLPHGQPGRLIFKKTLGETKEFVERIRFYLKGNFKESQDFSFSLKPFTLNSRLDNLATEGQVFFRPAKIKAKDFLRSWFFHLYINLLEVEGLPKKTFFISKDFSLEFKAIEKSDFILRELIYLYNLGNQKILRFFPEISWSYAEALFQKKTKSEALSKVTQKWNSKDKNNNLKGEAANPHITYFFKKPEDLFQDEFFSLAEKIYRPIVENSTWIKID